MSDNKSVKRVELDEENLDVAGGRMSMGEAMAEAQQDKLNGGNGNFFMIWLKKLFGFNNANSANNPLQGTLDSFSEDYHGGRRDV